ncbi:hypothetical protein AX16_007244 [Volvariella volvacea WC 439]|nr:hypothetical protein AX16_007244 [Volvariella volvacea WC 439]
MNQGRNNTYEEELLKKIREGQEAMRVYQELRGLGSAQVASESTKTQALHPGQGQPQTNDATTAQNAPSAYYRDHQHLPSTSSAKSSQTPLQQPKPQPPHTEPSAINLVQSHPAGGVFQGILSQEGYYQPLTTKHPGYIAPPTAEEYAVYQAWLTNQTAANAQLIDSHGHQRQAVAQQFQPQSTGMSLQTQSTGPTTQIGASMPHSKAIEFAQLQDSSSGANKVRAAPAQQNTNNPQTTQYQQTNTPPQAVQNNAQATVLQLNISKGDAIRVHARQQANLIQQVISRWAPSAPSHSYFPIDGTLLKVYKNKSGVISIIRPQQNKSPEHFSEKDLPHLLEQELREVYNKQLPQQGQSVPAIRSSSTSIAPGQSVSQPTLPARNPRLTQAATPIQAPAVRPPVSTQSHISAQPQLSSLPPASKSNDATRPIVPPTAQLPPAPQPNQANQYEPLPQSVPNQSQKAFIQSTMIVPYEYSPQALQHQQQRQITNNTIPLPPVRAQSSPTQGKSTLISAPRTSSPLSKDSSVASTSTRTAAQADKKHLARDILRALGAPSSHTPQKDNSTEAANAGQGSAVGSLRSTPAPFPPSTDGVRTESDIASEPGKEAGIQRASVDTMNVDAPQPGRNSSHPNDIKQSTAFQSAVSRAVAAISSKLASTSSYNNPTTNSGARGTPVPTAAGTIVDGLPNGDMVPGQDGPLPPMNLLPATSSSTTANQVTVHEAAISMKANHSTIEVFRESGNGSSLVAVNRMAGTTSGISTNGGMTSSGSASGANRRATGSGKENFAYVLVPPLPDYLRKRKRKQRGQSESSSSRGAPSDNEEEVRLLKLVKTRFSKRDCKWNGCGAVLNSSGGLLAHLQEHCSSNGSKEDVSCLWQQCGQFFLRDTQLLDHISIHALTPYACPYGGCDQTFRTSQQLVRHCKGQHENGGAPKPGASPFAPTSAQLQELSSVPNPKTLPAYMVESRPVFQFTISAERHAILGPWVLRNIAGPVSLGNKRYNAALPLRSALAGSANGSTGPMFRRVDHTPYEYMAISSTHFSTMPSQPAPPTKIRNMLELNSTEVSELFNEGLVLWPPSEAAEDTPDREATISGPEAEAEIGNRATQEQHTTLDNNGAEERGGEFVDAGASEHLAAPLGELVQGDRRTPGAASGDESEVVEMMLAES